MSIEQKQFIAQNLLKPRIQLVENLASESQETNRIPDPYTYIIKGGKLLTPMGELVDDVVENRSYIGKVEYKAHEKIQKWAKEKSEGTSVWFSPPFPGKYEVSKLIISEILTNNDTKVLFNRAVVLDINAESLLGLANILSESFHSNNPEFLRETPIFPIDKELGQWLNNLSLMTNQIEMMQENYDIFTKTDTYVAVEDVVKSKNITGNSYAYESAHSQAMTNGLIGSYIGSCSTPTTPFETMMQNSKIVQKNELECKCPVCEEKVHAPIRNGKIHCPNCKSSAPYAC